MPKGSVYALLRKLVAKGLVIPTEETSEHRETRGGRGPARVLYTTPPDMLDHFPFIRILVARKFKELLAAQAAK